MGARACIDKTAEYEVLLEVEASRAAHLLLYQLAACGIRSCGVVGLSTDWRATILHATRSLGHLRRCLIHERKLPYSLLQIGSQPH